MSHAGIRVVQNQREARGFAGEHRGAGADGEREAGEVAEGVQDRGDAQSGEQEDEAVTEAQVVIDRADQQHNQRDGEEQAGARGQHIDAPLVQQDRYRFGCAYAQCPGNEAVVQIAAQRQQHGEFG
jgi:hypothetical protein